MLKWKIYYKDSALSPSHFNLPDLIKVSFDFLNFFQNVRLKFSNIFSIGYRLLEIQTINLLKIYFKTMKIDFIV